MTTFMEQVAEMERWVGPAQDEQNVRSAPAANENLSDISHDAPRLNRKALLTSIVEAEILPRLARIRARPAAQSVTPPLVTTADDSAELVRLLLEYHMADAITFVDSLRTRGATPASLYLGIVTDAARILGELWEDDRCDFTQVTIGLGHLQHVMHALSPHFQIDTVRRAQTETVLLAPAPGEQHTLGLVMLAEFFRREGWHVAGGPATSAGDVAGIVRGTWIDVVGFSVGSAARLEAVAQCIRGARLTSSNPNIFVMVGGPLFLAQPDLVTRVGADSTAPDAPSAVRQANGLIAIQTAAG
jgi:methanogenic corrinoid protein MtbC1